MLLWWCFWFSFFILSHTPKSLAILMTVAESNSSVLVCFSRNRLKMPLSFCLCFELRNRTVKEKRPACIKDSNIWKITFASSACALSKKHSDTTSTIPVKSILLNSILKTCLSVSGEQNLRYVYLSSLVLQDFFHVLSKVWLSVG